MAVCLAFVWCVILFWLAGGDPGVVSEVLAKMESVACFPQKRYLVKVAYQVYFDRCLEYLQVDFQVLAVVGTLVSLL